MNSYSLLVFVPVQYSGKHIRCQFTDSGPWTKTRYFRIVYVKHLIFGPKWFMSILRGHVKIWHDVLNSWLLAQDKLPLNLCLFSREFPMFEERTFFLVFRNLLPLYFTTYAWCCESFKVLPTFTLEMSIIHVSIIQNSGRKWSLLVLLRFPSGQDDLNGKSIAFHKCYLGLWFVQR